MAANNVDTTFGLSHDRATDGKITVADEASSAAAEGGNHEPTKAQLLDSETISNSQPETYERYTPDEHELSDACLQTLGQAAQTCLCSICRNFPRGNFDDLEKKLYHTSLISLERSVSDGCRLCKILSGSLEDFCSGLEPPQSAEPSCTIYCRIEWHEGKDVITLLFYLHNSEDQPVCTGDPAARSPFKWLDFDAAKKFKLGPEFSCPLIRTTTAQSRMSLDLARGWYQQCLGHPICRKWEEESRVLPTRLVYIWEPHGKASTIHAKLYDAVDLPIATKYTTLSHCWGKAPFFKLESSNMDSLHCEIPIQQLPKTFHDAMRITLELGINYLWIDSLCIIQDSKADWVHESRRMGNVYRYSEFTIAAASYPDGSLGLFSERETMPYIHFPLHVEHLLIRDWQHAYGRDVAKARLDGFYITAERFEFHDEVVGSLLNSRAWVAQERALSPGTPHYTREKVWWECNDLMANEAFPIGDFDWGRGEGNLEIKGRGIRSARKGGRDRIYAFWRDFIGFYAGTEITKEGDRFPAATGIARIIGNLVNDNFIAGFWEGDLQRSLVWASRGEIKGFSSARIAPSWSWASLRGRLEFSSHDFPGPGSNNTVDMDMYPLSGIRIQALSDVRDFKSDLQSTSFERSGVRGLAISGPLRKMPIDLASETGYHFPSSEYEWLNFIQIHSENMKMDESLRQSLAKDQEWRLGEPTHLLPLAYNRRSVYAIVLQQVPDAIEPNTFRRFGRFRFCFRKPEVRDVYLGLSQKDGKYQPSLRFEECDRQDLILI